MVIDSAQSRLPNYLPLFLFGLEMRLEMDRVRRPTAESMCRLTGRAEGRDDHHERHADDADAAGTPGAPANWEKSVHTISTDNRRVPAAEHQLSEPVLISESGGTAHFITLPQVVSGQLVEELNWPINCN